MKIGVVTTSMNTPFTGIAEYTDNLTTELARINDLELHYFNGREWSQTDKIVKSTGVVKRAVAPLPSFLRSGVRKVAHKYFQKKSDAFQVDLLHDTNYIPPTYKYPTVITIHDMSHLRFPEYHPAERIKFLKRELPKAIEKSEHIISISEFTKNEILEAHDCDPDKISVVHNGISPVYLEDGDPDAESKILANHNLLGEKFILCTGTIEPRKNVRVLIEAFDKLDSEQSKDLKIVFVGRYGWHAEDLAERIEELKSRGKGIWLTGLSHEELRTLYRHCAAFAYPSVYEGFGLPPVEAMAQGAKVIVSDIEVKREILRDHGRYCDPFDAYSWVEEIERAISDRAEINSREERRAFARSYTWERAAGEICDVYKTILEKQEVTL